MAQAAWNGLGDLLPVLLGVACASLTVPPPYRLAWLPAVFVAASVTVFRRAVRPAFARSGLSARAIATAAAAGAIGPVALGVHWALSGRWLPFAVGVAGVAVVAGGQLLRKRVRDPIGYVPDLIMATLVLPLLGALIAGLGPWDFSWWVPAGLLPSAAGYVLSDWTAPPRTDQWSPRAQRSASAGLALLGAAGAVTAARLLPGPSEATLLAIAAPAVVITTAAAALLHPAAGAGLVLTRTIVRLEHLAIVAGFSIVYLIQ